MKFKVGDKVKMVWIDPEFEENTDKEYLGRTGVVVAVEEEYDYPYEVDFEGTSNKNNHFSENQLELVKAGRPAKPKPVLYAVFYEEDGVDPLKEFYSRKELNDWLKKASEDRSIRWDSIRVIEKPKFLKVEVSKSFRLKA
jgi:hypothetical protein